MDETIAFLIILAIGLLLSGPIALVISIIALNKTKELLRQIQSKEASIAKPVMQG